MKARIHINKHVVQQNVKYGRRDPAITVKTSKENRYAHEVEINGPSKVVSDFDKGLNCGAKIWIEADSEDLNLKESKEYAQEEQ